MNARNVGRAVACVAVLATALQLGACSRADNSQKAASVSEPQVSAASSEPEPSAMPQPRARANEAETPRASDAPMKPMNKDAGAPSMPRPAKPLLDPHKGSGTLEPPRLLEA